MESAKTSFQLQAKVQQNAEDIVNTFSEMNSWLKQIKEREKEILNKPEYNIKESNHTLPVRSHIKDVDNKKPANNNASSGTSPLMNNTTKSEPPLSPSTEKHDTPYDPQELKHKEADEIKDRGNRHVKLGDYQTAIEEYTDAIKHYPYDAIYFCNRALCYLKLERYDECIEDCDHAIEIDNLAVKAYYRRMMANESLGNNMDALKDCSTVLMIEPKNTEAKRSLERINERLRKNVKSTKGPNFSPLRPNMVDILPIDKPSYKRSTKPMKRVIVADVVGPKDSKNYDNLTISDEDIDKLFNSNCGHFEEIKSAPSTTTKTKVMNQTSANVSAKHKLEPNKTLTQKEKEKETTTVKTTERDASSEKSIEDSNKMIPTNERPLPPAPISTAQFYSNWRELTARQKYQYLKSIPLPKLCKVLGAGFDSETLADIIQTLHDFYLTQKDPSTSATLLEISKNKQVAILSLLMSTEERKALSEIVNSLKETKSLDTKTAEQIMKNFNLN